MNDTKPWYLSKTIWASLISVAAVAANAFGFHFGAEQQAALVDGVLQLVAGAAGLFAVFGRLVAKDQIG